MIISNILKGFDNGTKIKYYIDDNLIEDINTVEDWLNNGLCAYIQLLENEPKLSIEDNCIIIKLSTDF